MRRILNLVLVLGGAIGCWSAGGLEPEEREPETSWVPSEAETPESTRATVSRELQLEMAREAFTAADSMTPPPPVGSVLPLLRISRPIRAADELGQRLTALLSIMGLALDPSKLTAWADVAIGASHTADLGDPSISEPSPGLVVVYDMNLDTIMVVNTSCLDMDSRIDTHVAPWEDARRVAEGLGRAGITEPSPSFEDAEVTFVRSGVEGPDGTHEQWVDEIIFDARPQVEGVDIVDAGVRLGITPTGKVSSLRVAGIVTERVGVITVGATVEALRDAFAEYLVGSATAFESVHVGMRRPVYVLDRGMTSAVVEPQYLIEYSILVRDGDELSVSRSTITLWDMASPKPTLVARLPPAQGSLRD